MSRRSPFVAIPPVIDPLHLPDTDPDNPPSTEPPYPPPNNSSHRSFAERKANISSQSPSLPPINIVEGSDIMNRIGRAPPGDVTGARTRSESTRELTKQKSAYFEDAFKVKETVHPAKQKVLNSSVIHVDVKTNADIENEEAFTIKLARFIASRYARPITSIFIHLDYGTLTMFGGTFEPNFCTSITALASQVQPTTNKRNAALISRFFYEELGIRLSQGVVRFTAIAEENIAQGGKTLAGELEEAGRMTPAEASAEFIGIKPAPIMTSSKPKSRLSVRSLTNFRSASTAHPSTAEDRRPASARETRSQSGGDGAAGGGLEVLPEERTTKRKKSFVSNLFRRDSRSGS